MIIKRQEAAYVLHVFITDWYPLLQFTMKVKVEEKRSGENDIFF